MVHLTETCDPDEVHLITHVETTPASVHEIMRIAPIHQALDEKGPCPGEHLVDAGYISADVLVSAHERHAIEVIGPPRPKQNWQARTEGAYTADRFQVDWEERRAICPQGKTSLILERNPAQGWDSLCGGPVQRGGVPRVYRA